MAGGGRLRGAARRRVLVGVRPGPGAPVRAPDARRRIARVRDGAVRRAHTGRRVRAGRAVRRLSHQLVCVALPGDRRPPAVVLVQLDDRPSPLGRRVRLALARDPRCRHGRIPGDRPHRVRAAGPGRLGGAALAAAPVPPGGDQRSVHATARRPCRHRHRLGRGRGDLRAPDHRVRAGVLRDDRIDPADRRPHQGDLPRHRPWAAVRPAAAHLLRLRLVHPRAGGRQLPRRLVERRGPASARPRAGRPVVACSLGHRKRARGARGDRRHERGPRASSSVWASRRRPATSSTPSSGWACSVLPPRPSPGSVWPWAVSSGHRSRRPSRRAS